MQKDLEQMVRDFLHTLENRHSAKDLEQFYHPEVEHIEFPNAVTPATKVRDLAGLQEASEKGKALLQKETYAVKKIYVFENTAILEALWTGTLAIPLGNIPAGGNMQANFAQFFEFKEGKIIRQRNYDCFDPFK